MGDIIFDPAEYKKDGGKYIHGNRQGEKNIISGGIRDGIHVNKYHKNTSNQ